MSWQFFPSDVPSCGVLWACAKRSWRRLVRVPCIFLQPSVQVGLKAIPFWSEKPLTSSVSAALQSVGIINGHERMRADEPKKNNAGGTVRYYGHYRQFRRPTRGRRCPGLRDDNRVSQR